MAKGSGGPVVGRAYVTIIPTTKDAQKNIAKSLVPDMEKASEQAGEEGGETLVEKLGATIASGAQKVAAATKVVAAAGVAALGALTTAAYNAFSDWEQLSGGVQTIFGDAAAETVIANAKRAFKTVQLSANDYLSTVTSFSASLIQSLGGDTDAAASVADKAITDMADNANKMGTSMESLQYAYQGFSRGTFAMLDNLKLGYSGSQSEMLRLVHDAGVVDKSINDISQVSFADMIEGIHIIQQNLGITGASAEEASTTLEGSFNTMTASWQNLLVAFGEGTPEAIKPAVDNLIESVGTWLKNAIPRIGIIISGIISYIPTLTSDIIAALPGMVTDISTAVMDALGNVDLASMLKPVIDVAMENSLIASIVGFAGRIGEAFTLVFGDVDLAATFESIKGAVVSAMDVIGPVIQGMQDAFGSLLDSIDTATIVDVMSGMKEIGEALLGILLTIGETVAHVMVTLVGPALSAFWEFFTEHILPGLKTLWDAIQPAVMLLLGILGDVYSWVSQIIMAVADELGPEISLIMGIAGPIFDTIVATLSTILQTLTTVASFLWDHLKQAIDRVVSDVVGGIELVAGWIKAVTPIVSAVIQRIKGIISVGITILKNVISAAVSAIRVIISRIFTTVSNIVTSVKKTFANGFNYLLRIAGQVVSGIGNIFRGVVNAITAPFQSAINSIRRLWNSSVGSLSVSIPSWVPGVGGKGFSMPKLASGGTIMEAGSVMVGEAGPEILTLPRGASVRPLSSDTATAGGETWNVQVGDVTLSDDDEVRRITRAYLEQLARLATPGGIIAATY